MISVLFYFTKLLFQSKHIPIFFIFLVSVVWVSTLHAGSDSTARIGLSGGFGYAGIAQPMEDKTDSSQIDGVNIDNQSLENVTQTFYGPMAQINFQLSTKIGTAKVGPEIGYAQIVLNPKTNGAIDKPKIAAYGGRAGLFIRPDPSFIMKVGSSYLSGNSKVTTPSFFTSKELLSSYKFLLWGMDAMMGGSIPIETAKSSFYIDIGFQYHALFFKSVNSETPDITTRIDYYGIMLEINLPLVDL